MRLGLSLIVVPNDSLLDNHQLELAEELELQGYATKSTTRLAKFPFYFHKFLDSGSGSVTDIKTVIFPTPFRSRARGAKELGLVTMPVLLMKSIRL
jgi:hypothetical protein